MWSLTVMLNDPAIRCMTGKDKMRKRDGKSPLYLILSNDHPTDNERKYSLRIYVDPRLWDRKSFRLMGKDTHTRKINLAIARILDDVETIQFDLVAEQGLHPSLSEWYSRVVSYFEQKTFCQLGEAFFQKLLALGEIKPKTQYDYLNKLKALQAYRDPLVHECNKEFIEGYISHLIAQGRERNGINADLRVLKRVSNHALEEGLITKNPFQGISTASGVSSKEQVFLTIPEVDKLWTLYQQEYTTPSDQAENLGGSKNYA